MTNIELCVQSSELLAPRIRQLVFASADGTRLPGYSAGAHIKLHVPADGPRPPLHRAYSLVTPYDGGTLFKIAVQLEESGSGGSRWVHELNVGDVLTASAPQNDFPMAIDGIQHVLLAGGIGITPILCMAKELETSGRPVELHYAARERSLGAYCNDVEELGGQCWFDGGNPDRGLPLADVIGQPAARKHLYVCGPKPFIAAALEAGTKNGWQLGNLHCELFQGSLSAGNENAFTVCFADTDIELEVPVGKSVMDVMEEAGMDPIYDCRRGECGVCVATVQEGEADHRDICLSARERENGSFCTCVSRARSDRLVLKL